MNILHDKRLDSPSPQVDKDGLLAELRLRLPDLGLLHAAGDLRPYECDGFSAYRCTLLPVALLERTEQAQGLLVLCRRLKMPVAARGTDTGLSDGALPLESGALLMMACFQRILKTDPLGRFTRVQPDMRSLAISQAAASHGLYYASDPPSQIACSIGGSVAENAGGIHCLKYDLTVHSLLQVDIVTLEGEHLSLGSNTLDSVGSSPLALLTGSEGLLGVVVEVTIRLSPRPPVARVLLASFDDVKNAGWAMIDLISDGIVPVGLGMIDSLSIRAVEDFIHAGYPVDTVAILLCELDDMEADVHEGRKRVHELLEATGSTSARQAQDEAERQRFWTGCRNVLPAVKRISPDHYCMDDSIPRREPPRVLHSIAELLREYGLRVVSVFHIGDGNMHSLVLFDANLPGELERAETSGGRIPELCVAVGGSITGEHGISREKVNQMYAQFDADELTLFHTVKAVLDPAGLLGPGKDVSTLHRCVELGAIHVHHGRLPFPELEYF